MDASVRNPRRLAHELPAHHGRRRQHPDPRSRGRGRPRRCRRTVPDSRDRSSRAASRRAPHRTRRQSQRRERHRSAAGQGRDARRGPSRRIRGRARGRGSGALPWHRRAGNRSGDFQPGLYGSFAERPQNAGPGELRCNGADARAADAGIQRGVRDHVRRCAVGHDRRGSRRLGGTPDDVRFHHRTDRRADGRSRQLRPHLFDPCPVPARRCGPPACGARQRCSTLALSNRRAQAGSNHRIGAGESSADFPREPDHRARLPEHALLRGAAVPSSGHLRRVRGRRSVRVLGDLSAGAAFAVADPRTRDRTPPRCGVGRARRVCDPPAPGIALGVRTGGGGARRINTP